MSGTWHDIKRSTTPLNWQRMLNDLTFTTGELESALREGRLVSTIVNRTIEVMKMTDPNNDEVVDMDEVLNDQESEIEPDAEKEPETVVGDTELPPTSADTEVEEVSDDKEAEPDEA